MGDETDAAATSVAAAPIAAPVTAPPLAIVVGRAGREVRLRGHATARALAAVLAVALGAGIVRWLVVAGHGIHPCAGRSRITCEAAPVVTRWVQFVAAVAGAAVGAVLVAYCVRFALLATVWRRRAHVVAAFLGAVTVWVVVYGIGAVMVRS